MLLTYPKTGLALALRKAEVLFPDNCLRSVELKLILFAELPYAGPQQRSGGGEEYELQLAPCFQF